MGGTELKEADVTFSQRELLRGLVGLVDRVASFHRSPDDSHLTSPYYKQAMRQVNGEGKPTHLLNDWRNAKWEQKDWGEVLHLFLRDDAAVSMLHVEKDFRCSRHYHKDRANMFIVVSGKIDVLICDHKTSPGPRVAHLESGHAVVVESGCLHWFEVVEAGTVIEVYWADKGGKVSIDDIVRKDVGGPVEGS